MSQLATGLQIPYTKFAGTDGTSAANGYIVTYAAGTSSLQNTYSDNALTSVNANSATLASTLRLDANGGAILYALPLNYKVDVFDSTGTRLPGFPRDNVSGTLWPGLLAANGTLAPAANANGLANQVTSTINKNSAGTHALFAGAYFGTPTIGAGASTLTEASCVYIDAAPATGSNLYSLHVVGAAKFDGAVSFSGSFANPTFSGTVSGTPAWASPQAITLSTAAQPNVTSVGTLTSLATAGKITTYNNIATAGWGVEAIQANGRLTAQTAAIGTVATYTVGGADGSFIVSANVLVTTATTHSFTVNCVYTDEGNTSRTCILSYQLVGGAAATGSAISNSNGTVPYMFYPLQIRCKAATSITINTTGTFTTVVYNVEGSIRQIA